MDQFIDRTEELFDVATPATMLRPGILRSYQDGLRRLTRVEGIRMRRSAVTAEEQKTEAQPALIVSFRELFPSPIKKVLSRSWTLRVRSKR